MSIIVGIDDSGPSRAAFTWAVERARALGTSLLAVHVVDDGWGPPDSVADEHRVAVGEKLLADCRAIATQRAPELDFASAVAHGSPVRTLLSFATTEDELVVGTHKTGYLHGRVRGTRSLALTVAAHCTIVVVPEGDFSSRRGIVAGVSAGEMPDDALAHAALEAERRDRQLTLVHAAPAGARDPLESRTPLVAAATVCSTAAPGVSVHARNSRQSPADALLDASRTAELLVLGTHSTHNPEPFSVVIHEVLLNINAPVMIVRTGETESRDALAS